MKVVDIADEIYRELGSPSDTNIAPITYWLRNNIGRLNSAINTKYYIKEDTLEIVYDDDSITPTSPVVTEIGEDEKAILKLMYTIYYYDIQIRKNMLNYTTAPAVEVTSDGHTVRLASPTEVGKNIYMFRKGIADELKLWINWYRSAKATPRQVTGDDTVEGPTESRPIYRRTFNLYH